MKLPFGKHKDKEINEIPTNYLLWLVSNPTMPGLSAEILGEVNTVLDSRSAKRPDRKLEIIAKYTAFDRKPFRSGRGGKHVRINRVWLSTDQICSVSEVATPIIANSDVTLTHVVVVREGALGTDHKQRTLWITQDEADQLEKVLFG